MPVVQSDHGADSALIGPGLPRWSAPRQGQGRTGWSCRIIYSGLGEEKEFGGLRFCANGLVFAVRATLVVHFGRYFGATAYPTQASRYAQRAGFFAPATLRAGYTFHSALSSTRLAFTGVLKTARKTREPGKQSRNPFVQQRGKFCFGAAAVVWPGNSNLRGRFDQPDDCLQVPAAGRAT